MSLSFPASPSVNQTSTKNGRVYKWSGSAWEFAGGGGSGLTWSSVPANAFAAGTAGDMAYDGSYLYVCTATNTWVRYTGATWDTPSTIAGLQLWLDASYAPSLYDATSGGSLVAADGSVARWEDRSGNGRHATQGTSGSRPLRKTSVQSGKDVIRFDGSDDWLSIGSSTGAFRFLHGGNGYSVFAVCQFRASEIRQGILHTGAGGSESGDSGSVGASLSGNASTGSISYGAWNGAVEPRPIGNTLSSAITTNQFLLVSATGIANSGTASLRSALRKNGGAATTGNTSTSTASTADALHDLRIARLTSYNGAGSLDYDVYATIDVAELLIYDSALSDTDRGAVETYLLNKWSIT